VLNITCEVALLTFTYTKMTEQHPSKNVSEVCGGIGGTLSLPLYILLGSPSSNWNRSNNYAYPSSSKSVSIPGL